MKIPVVIPVISALIASSLFGGAAEAPPLKIAAGDLRIEGDLGTFKSSWDVSQPEAHVMLATLTLESPKAAAPPAIQVKWDVPSVDVAGVWVSDYGKAKLDHERVRVQSRAVQRAPLVMYLSQGDRNRFTVALSDSLRPVMLRGGIKEEDSRLYMTLSLFQEKHPEIKKYQVTLRFDTRPDPYYSVLRDTAKWWASQPDYKPAPVPNAARVPLYSTWYSYHQNLNPDTLVEECRIGGELGLEGIIVDDGWQTLDGNRGYAYTGDWKPDRIPDMKGFVDRVHALGQKFFLWYSVPMAGEQSKMIKRFKGKTLSFNSGFGAHVLDPRYPEVREYLIGVYENAVRDWGLDGLKLDFIGMFAPNKNTVLTAEDGRDFASVDQAVDRLMTDVMTRLRKLKPDIGIEFRQPYNGPLMRKYGNMLRAVDCPNCAPVNRKHIVDLRLLADNTAVHSDMIMWHQDEPVESAALQILNILFSVPQISVKLPEVSEDHRKMIGFWMRYWKGNRDILLDGEFQPGSPAQNYPIVVGRGEDKMIAAIYQDLVVSPGPKAPAAIDVVNGKPGSDVVVNFSKAYGPATVRIRDCRGALVSEKEIKLVAGARSWEVPPSGLLEIRRIPSELLTKPITVEGEKAAKPGAKSTPEPAAKKPASSKLEKALKDLKLPGVELNLKERCVDVSSVVCLEHGLLELIACTKDTKEHESILMVEAKPSHVHMALLLIGAKPGSPAMRKTVGKNGSRWVDLPPRGGPVGVFLVFKDDKGKTVERPISDFISPSDDADRPYGRSGNDDGEDAEEKKFPTHTFLFAGSILHDTKKGPRKYLADMSGHVISIGTFGDEVLCLPGVHGHVNGMLMWQANSELLPKVGSKVILRLRPNVGPAGE